MLHLVSQSLTDSTILRRFAPGDDIVFLENAIFALAKKGGLAAELTLLLGHNPLFALVDDMAVRGMTVEELVDGIAVVDYAGLVRLAVKNPVIQSWY